MSALTLFIRYLFSSRSEALIRSLSRVSFVATFIGSASLVIVLSIMNGFNENIRSKLLAVEPHIAVTSPLPSLSPLLREKKADYGIESVIQYEQQDVVLRTLDGLFGGAIARGLSAEDLETLLQRIEAARKPLQSPMFLPQMEEKEVLLGVDLARSLNVYEGDEITVIPPEALLLPAGEVPKLERVRIKGILQTEVADFDSKFMLYVQGRSLRSFAGAETLKNMLEVRLFQPQDYADVRDRLVRDFEIPDAKISDWTQRNSALFFALRMEKMAMTLLLGLSLFVTSFSIVMVLLMLLTEKQKDIGLFMAMGLSRKQTFSIFTRIGMALAMCGTLGGVVVGMVVSVLIRRFPIPFMPAVYYDSTLPSRVDPFQICFLVLFLFALSVATAWVPVRRILAMTPSETLRGLGRFTRAD